MAQTTGCHPCDGGSRSRGVGQPSPGALRGADGPEEREENARQGCGTLGGQDSRRSAAGTGSWITPGSGVTSPSPHPSPPERGRAEEGGGLDPPLETLMGCLLRRLWTSKPGPSRKRGVRRWVGMAHPPHDPQPTTPLDGATILARFTVLSDFDNENQSRTLFRCINV